MKIVKIANPLEPDSEDTDTSDKNWGFTQGFQFRFLNNSDYTDRRTALNFKFNDFLFLLLWSFHCQQLKLVGEGCTQCIAVYLQVKNSKV